MNRLPRFFQLFVVVASLMLVVGGSASAGDLPPGADGCNYFTGYTDGYFTGTIIPQCQPGGSGCYECAVAITDGPGYFFCTEVPGNPPRVNCTPLDYWPDWWPDPQPWVIGFGDAGLPPDALPPQDWGPGDDSAPGGDPGAGGGGAYCHGGRCYYSYTPPRRYAVPPGPHRPYKG